MKQFARELSRFNDVFTLRLVRIFYGSFSLMFNLVNRVFCQSYTTLLAFFYLEELFVSSMLCVLDETL